MRCALWLLIPQRVLSQIEPHYLSEQERATPFEDETVGGMSSQKVSRIKDKYCYMLYLK